MDSNDSNSNSNEDLISIITCVRNSENFLKECLDSITAQTYSGPIELSIYNDGSSDNSLKIIQTWYSNLDPKKQIQLILSSNPDPDQPKGCGGSKNLAIKQSRGNFLCFLDSDDIMYPERIEKQLELCRQNPDCIIGCKVKRIPAESTPRYIQWVNNLSQEQLLLQIYTCFGPTILMPTWFCSRKTFEKNGGKFEDYPATGVPEDLIFFYKHLRLGGGIKRSEEILLTYRYHPQATTFSILDETIWQIRLQELQSNILDRWSEFQIWNAGKEGRRFYRSLTEKNQKKVQGFLDVDRKKILKKFYTYEYSTNGNPKPKIPILPLCELKPPVIICMKFGLTDGEFESNLKKFNLKEGIDFIHFG